MNPVIQQMVNQKIQSLNVKELIRQAREHQISVTVKQAKEVLQILHAQPFDIGDEELVKKINKRLKKLDPTLYKKVRKLLKPYEKYLDYSIE